MDSVKHILVTGVSQGLGLAITKACLEAGWTVSGVSRRRSAEFDTLAELHAGRLRHQSFDLSATDDVARGLFEGFLPLPQRLDGLVNNAATAYDDIITNLNPEALRAMYAVNVFTPMAITKYFLRNLVSPVPGRHRSHLLDQCTPATRAWRCTPRPRGLEAFSKNTAREWASAGSVRTASWRASWNGYEQFPSPEQKARIYQRTALKGSRSDSVAATVVFC
jgi:3-oxoacyl-[acyl-carrier protein] reductase